MGYWHAAAAFAWRDLQWSRARTVFLVGAMAVSVASIDGVRSAANVTRSALQRESRAWLAGDLGVETGEALDEEQVDALNRMRSRGIDWTVVTTALTMGASDQSPGASLLAVKAVDPARYPFYGALTLEPAQALSIALRPDTAVVSKDALERFHLRIGDQILIGAAKFRISAAIAAEPDHFSGVTAMGVRCLLSERAFERSRIARSGDSLKLRILFRLPPGEDEPRKREELQDLFPLGTLTDYHQANRNAVSILDTTALFLNVIALLALILGATGLAMAVRQHIVERTYTLAVMKMIGGRTPQLAGIFFLEIAWLAAAGFASGLPLGWGIRASVLSLAAKYVVLPPVAVWDSSALLCTFAAGLAAVIPALMGTALAIGRLKPAMLLRRDFEPAPIRGSATLSGVAWAGVCVVLGAIATPLVGSWRLAAIVVATLVGSAVVAFILVHVALQVARRGTLASPLQNRPLWRHGFANLCRPGNRGRALIVALTMGLMMMIATFQLKRVVARAILEAMPFDRPDMIVPVIEASHLAEVREFLERQSGVDRVEVGFQARGRLDTVEGANIGSLVGCESEDAPQGAARGPGLLSISERVARRFGLREGSRLRFAIRGRVFPLTVAAVRRMNLMEEVWYAEGMDCGSLDPATFLYHAAVRIRGSRIGAVRRAFLEEFPAIPVGTAEDLAEVVGQMSHDAVLLARVVAWYALGSSLAVLIAIVSASRRARSREMAILSALGAQRHSLIKLFSLELAAMGMIAGAIGAVLAYGFTAVLVSAILGGVHASGEWTMPLIAMPAGGILSTAAGWLPLYGLLRQKPLEVLRGE